MRNGQGDRGMTNNELNKLKPCPFCNKKLIHTNGKRVNRYYKGEPTIYKHFQKDVF